jgi:hypothetical protein
MFSAPGFIARISHNAFVAWLVTATHPGMSAVFRSFGLLDVLSSMPRWTPVMRDGRSNIFTPVYTASLRNPVKNTA